MIKFTATSFHITQDSEASIGLTLERLTYLKDTIKNKLDINLFDESNAAVLLNALNLYYKNLKTLAIVNGFGETDEPDPPFVLKGYLRRNKNSKEVDIIGTNNPYFIIHTNKQLDSHPYIELIPVIITPDPDAERSEA